MAIYGREPATGGQGECGSPIYAHTQPITVADPHRSSRRQRTTSSSRNTATKSSRPTTPSRGTSGASSSASSRRPTSAPSPRPSTHTAARSHLTPIVNFCPLSSGASSRRLWGGSSGTLWSYVTTRWSMPLRPSVGNYRECVLFGALTGADR